MPHNNKQIKSIIFAVLTCCALTARAEAPKEAAAAADKPKAAAEKPQRVGVRLIERTITSLDDARSYARDWLLAAGLDLSIGKVRGVSGLFIVDLMEISDTSKLQNQLVLRKKDGLAVLVYSAMQHAPAKEAPVGMAGLEGMAGMQGLAGNVRQRSAAAHGQIPVQSTSDAKRGVNAWLWINGISSVEAGQVADFGGVYVADLVNPKKPKQVKNQALIRKADGFVALANPFDLPPPPVKPAAKK